MKVLGVSFLSGNLKLEGVAYMPDSAGPFAAVALCHPHPLHGGSMDSGVIVELADALVGRSIVALRFNFRGVGRSQGRFDNGIGEQDDVISAIDWLASLPQVDLHRIGLAGYSFGAGVAAQVAVEDDRVRAVSLISLVVDGVRLATLAGYAKPKQFICAENDTVGPPGPIAAGFPDLAPPKELEVIPGADHFWSGFETQVAAKVTGFFERYFQQA